MDGDAERAFVAYGPAHLGALVLLAGAYATLWWWTAEANRRRTAMGFATVVAAVILVHEVVNVALHLWCYEYPWRENLPLNFCRANMFVSAWMLLRHSFVAFEIAYFWAIVGGAAALITPDLREPFPHPLFFTFFVGHGVGIFAVLYAVRALGFAPRLRSIGVSFVAAVALAIVAWRVNALLGTNYLYLAAPPEGSELLDAFEPWPGYLVGVVVLGVVAAFVAWLPFSRRPYATQSAPTKGGAPR